MLFRDIYISYLSIRIPEIAFDKRHDPGHITYLTHLSQTEDIIIVEDKN